MSGGGSDWSDSLFKPEKGDSLGDGSWGRESDEPELAPVAWDKLPEAPDKSKARARLATPAPGSNKESGLLNIKQLAPDLMKDDSAGGSDAPAEGGSTGSAEKSGVESLSESSGAVKASSLSSSLVDQPAVPMPSDPEPELDFVPSSNNSLLFIVGLMALVVAGLAAYVFTR